MLISVDDLKKLYKKFESIDNETLTRKLKSIENIIRDHTNNKFQNRIIRIKTSIENGKINWKTNYLKEKDTIEISDGVNKGLYTIKSVSDHIEVNESLYDYPEQLITKIEYPINVIEGAIDLLDWELIQKGKEQAGIASEGISRHNVTYIQKTKDNTIKGYPFELFDFCEDYMRPKT